MAEIIIADKLRQSVELASGGKQTVLYTPKGQPTFMNVIKKQTMADLFPTLFPSDTTVHPAFVIGDKTLSQLYVGTYLGTIKNGELVSQPGTPRNTQATLTAWRAAAAASGTGHHTMSFTERALVNALSNKAGYNPLGLGAYGIVDSGDTSLYGLRTDKKAPGDTSSKSDVYNGSGPRQVRHDNSFTGISDVSLGTAYQDATTEGIHQHVAGIRMFDGEIQFLVNNDYAAVTDLTLLSTASRDAAWKALDGTTGNFITPTYATDTSGNVTSTTTDSVKIVASGTYMVAGLNTSMPANTISTTGNWNSFNNMCHNVSDAALKVLKMYGLYPYGNELTIATNAEAIRSINLVPQRGKVGTFARLVGFASIHGYAMYLAEDATTMRGVCRPAYYSPADLS
ncbi:TPA: hypothetical protein L9K94_005137 [Klebsiella pneumoniae]|nr:hypothetical protein [Klebsiella pneumoniae]